MEFPKTLLHRLLTLTLTKPSPSTSPTPTLLRRFLHKNTATVERPLPAGESLLVKVRERIRVDALSDPARMTVEQARKVLRVSEMEGVRRRLRGVGKGAVSYEEFVRICRDASGGDRGVGIARALDESGAVLVLGEVVFLRPDQVAQALEKAIPNSKPEKQPQPNHHELETLEKQKSSIDRKADALVKRELWCGLAFLVFQTLGFMRLTFWELSWDVMEPICFYVTSVYFMFGYAFFLRTSKDPSFEGFFDSRFESRQKQLMRKEGFDLRRLQRLRRESSGTGTGTGTGRMSDSCRSGPRGLGVGSGFNCGCHCVQSH